MSGEKMQVLLQEYGVSHRHPLNQMIHKVCVPAIQLCVFGLADQIPGPIPWMSVVFGLGMLYYFWTSTWKTALLMLVVSGFMLGLVKGTESFIAEPLWAFLGLFVLAWVGQFYGHHVEGRRPSFMKDLQFLLIGPVWIFLGNSAAAAAPPSDRA